METDIDRERFVPIRKTELVDCLCQSDLVAPKDRELFLRFSKILDSLFHFEFHSQTEALKESYTPFNPDRDTLITGDFSHDERKRYEKRLMAAFKAVLNQANFQEITEADLAYAMHRWVGWPSDFEIEEALVKLRRLELGYISGTDASGTPVWMAVSLSKACARLDFLWDNFFQMQ